MTDNFKHDIGMHLKYFPVQDRPLVERYEGELASIMPTKFSDVLASVSEETSDEVTNLKSVAAIIGLDKMIDDLDSCLCYDMVTGASFIKKIIAMTPTLLSGKYDLSPRMACARKGVIEQLLLHYIPFKLDGIRLYNGLHDDDKPTLQLNEFHDAMRHAYRRLQLNKYRLHYQDDIVPDCILSDIELIIDYVRALYDIFHIENADPTDNVENLYMHLIYLLTSSAPIYVKAKEMYKKRIVEPTNLTDIFQNNPNKNFLYNYQAMEATSKRQKIDNIREFSNMIMDNTKKQFNFFGDNVFKSMNIDDVQKEFRYLSKDKLASFANIEEEDSIEFKLDEQVGMYLKEELNCPICEVQMVRDGRVDYMTCILYEGDTYVLFTTAKRPDTIFGLSLLTGKNVTERKLLSFDTNEDTEFKLVMDDELK